MTIKRHIAYLKYVLRHKYYVLRACRLTGTSLWQGLIHDLSKFKPSQWFPYAECFYRPDGSKQYQESTDFIAAWLDHQKTNRHHWQAWVCLMDRGELVPIKMPEKYIREMVADWIGAGYAITGKLEVNQWYEKSKDKMLLHPHTRERVESILRCVDWLANTF